MAGSEANGSALPKSLNILCFGDSLTKGYLLTEPYFYPYGDTLQTELAHMLQTLPSKLFVSVDGLPGSVHLWSNQKHD